MLKAQSDTSNSQTHTSVKWPFYILFVYGLFPEIPANIHYSMKSAHIWQTQCKR